MNPGMNLENLHCLEALLTHLALEVLALLVDQVMPLLQVLGWIELAAVLALNQQVLINQMLPPVTLDLGHSGAGVVTASPVTPGIITLTLD